MANTKYNLVDFFDVWGNPKEGYEVNNQCVWEEDIYISPDSTTKEILRFLKKIGYLSTDDMRKVCLDEYGDTIEICAKKGMMPLGALIPVY